MERKQVFIILHMTPSKWICKDLNLTDFNKLEKFIFINRLKWKTVHLRSKRTITDRHTQKKKKKPTSHTI